jgi:hypothetical protein
LERVGQSCYSTGAPEVRDTLDRKAFAYLEAVVINVSEWKLALAYVRKEGKSLVRTCYLILGIVNIPAGSLHIRNGGITKAPIYAYDLLCDLHNMCLLFFNKR